MADKSAKTAPIRYSFGTSSLAALLLARSVKGVVAIIIAKHRDEANMEAELRRRFPRDKVVRDDDGLNADVASVVAFVDDPRQNLAFSLDVRGTEFQRSVYDAVLQVAFGETVTFSDIAVRIGRPKAVRAVGSACTRNPLEFAIPCHRVLRSDGKWAGGGEWGDRRQAALVERERAASNHGRVDRRQSL